MRCTCGHVHDGGCPECLCPDATDDPSPVEMEVNQRWPLLLPPHLAYRPEFVWREGWEWRRLDDMHARLQPGATLVDVGAEQGDLTTLYASWGLDVAVVEPAPAVWPSIKACFDANGLLPWWTLNAFCGEEPRGVGMVNSGWPSAAFGKVDTEAGFVRVEERPDLCSVTLDQATAGRKVDAVTMDVEGAELLVLAGARELLLEQRPTVWCSIHECFMEPYGYNVGQLFRFMEALGYGWTLLDVDHEWHVRFDPDGGRVRIVNTCERCGGVLDPAQVGYGLLSCQQCGRLDVDDRPEQ